jgi:hypothetical protein
MADQFQCYLDDIRSGVLSVLLDIKTRQMLLFYFIVAYLGSDALKLLKWNFTAVQIAGIHEVSLMMTSSLSPLQA